MKNKNIMIITLLSDKKLLDKIYPIQLGMPNWSINVVRRKKGPELDNVNYIYVKNKFSEHPFIGTLLVYLKVLFLMPKLKPSLIISFYYFPHGFFALLIGLFYRKKVITSFIGTDRYILFNNFFKSFHIRFLKLSNSIVVTGSKMKKTL